ncbi:MAG: hypothetical protein FJY85_15790 [Deltaproteobacteria bacterium]|nr:hypothetical protein [Deltaproteobacteria bacterium]
MKNEPTSHTPERASIVQFDEYRKSVATGKSSRKSTRVMVEVACNDPVGADIKACLTKHLRELGRVVVSDHQPDWVFSIIAFRHMNLVQLSVVLRQFFRSTRPGTEMAKPDGVDQERLRDGGWVYESLKFHGLFGVRDRDLRGFLGNLAKEFGLQHAAPVRGGKTSPAK